MSQIEKKTKVEDKIRGFDKKNMMPEFEFKRNEVLDKLNKVNWHKFSDMSDAVCGSYRYYDKIMNNILEEKNMNKDKVAIAFRLTNNGYWSCEQVKTKILEYISDTDAEINVTYPNDEFDDDFSVDISVDRNWANRLNFAEFMKWCKFNIVENRPLIHGFRSESGEDGYKITFETTSAEEYRLVQSFIRKNFIDKDEQAVLFHCGCGCDFSIKAPVFVKQLLVYETNCPACHTICRRAIEED